MRVVRPTTCPYCTCELSGVDNYCICNRCSVRFDVADCHKCGKHGYTRAFSFWLADITSQRSHLVDFRPLTPDPRWTYSERIRRYDNVRSGSDVICVDCIRKLVEDPGTFEAACIGAAFCLVAGPLLSWFGWIVELPRLVASIREGSVFPELLMLFGAVSTGPIFLAAGVFATRFALRHRPSLLKKLTRDANDQGLLAACESWAMRSHGRNATIGLTGNPCDFDYADRGSTVVISDCQYREQGCQFRLRGEKLRSEPSGGRS